MVGTKDANRIHVLMGVSETDGVTPTSLTVDPTTQRLRVKVVVKDNSAFAGYDKVERDDNREPALMGQRNDTGEQVQLTVSPINGLRIQS